MSVDALSTRDNGPTAQDNGASSQGTSSSSQSSNTPTQSSDTPSQKLPKVWALEGGTMTVVGAGKKRPRDTCMTLELEFKFNNEKKPRIVGSYLKTLS